MMFVCVQGEAGGGRSRGRRLVRHSSGWIHRNRNWHSSIFATSRLRERQKCCKGRLRSERKRVRKSRDEWCITSRNRKRALRVQTIDQFWQFILGYESSGNKSKEMCCSFWSPKMISLALFPQASQSRMNFNITKLVCYFDFWWCGHTATEGKRKLLSSMKGFLS